MKTFISLFVTVLLFFSFGCQNATGPDINREIKEVSVKSSEVFEFHTGISGIEELAKIKQQPEHYEISKIVRDSTTNWEAVYKYKPESGFKGIDYAVIKLGTGSNGASPNTHIEIIKIEITVN